MKRALLALFLLALTFTAGVAARQWPGPYAPWAYWNDVTLAGPLPCGSPANMHTASMSHPSPRAAIVYYVCNDGTHMVREYSFLDTPPCKEGMAPTPQGYCAPLDVYGVVTPMAPVDPRQSCARGLVPGRNGYCVPKGSPIAW